MIVAFQIWAAEFEDFKNGLLVRGCRVGSPSLSSNLENNYLVTIEAEGEFVYIEPASSTKNYFSVKIIETKPKTKVNIRVSFQIFARELADLLKGKPVWGYCLGDPDIFTELQRNDLIQVSEEVQKLMISVDHLNRGGGFLVELPLKMSD